MKIIVDQETCIGCALCVQNCPEIFRMEKNNKAIAYQDHISRVNKISELCLQTVDDCPVDAILINDE
ncbi:MAG: ferredoxin [bacterium]